MKLDFEFLKQRNIAETLNAITTVMCFFQIWMTILTFTQQTTNFHNP